MPPPTGKSLRAAALIALLACVGPYERGERLYRQGDVRQALDVWRKVTPNRSDYTRAQSRLQIVGNEFDRLLRRYEKRAQFFENEGRLAEAVLYYRLAYKLDPDRSHVLDHVQKLVRQLHQRETEDQARMIKALDRGQLRRASHHAARLEQLDPFNAALQIEIRQVHAAVGAEVLRHLEAGKRAYAAGQRGVARKAFETVLKFDHRNETALGYLSYIKRFVAMETQRKIPPPPRSVSVEEIESEGRFRSAREAEEAGEPFLALQEYEAALRADPDHEQARNALSALRSELRPQIEELYESGKRYFQDEDLHNALRVWRRVLLIDPTHERARENSERAERILSRLEEIETDAP